jgi:recombination protein RecT
VKLAQAAVAKTPNLALCTAPSVLVTLMRCAELGLEPGSPLGGMHLIPYKNKKTGKYECQGIIDYRGLIDLVRRSGDVSMLYAEVRYSKDKWERALGTDPHIRHEPAEDEDRGDVVGFYAAAKLRSGEVQMAYMSLKEVQAIRNRSRAGESGPWVTDFNEMGKKTVLRRICKQLPMSAEVKRQVADEELVDAGKPVPVDPTVFQDLGIPPEEGVVDEPESTASEVEKKLAAMGEKPAGPPPKPPDGPREPGQEG